MWRLAVMVAACGRSADPTPPPVPAPILTSPPPARVSTHAKMHAQWTAVRSEASCWYFSGPAGRETKLAGDVVFDRDGASVTMTFGDAVFKGTYRDNVLELERKAGYVFQGRWTTRETIKGDYLAGKVVAHYHYEECAVGMSCQNECRIEATLAFAI